ncbi:MAG: peptide chain release factor N(5)-glutamine methyltransferase [Cytophagaceae bacterium]
MEANNTISSKELWDKSLSIITSYDIQEKAAILNRYFSEILDISPTQRLANINIHWNEDRNNQWAEVIQRINAHEPIQHIIGYTYFLDHKIYVNSNTLIPRPETEEIVHGIIQQLPINETKKIIDICSGSGCIAISLAKHFTKAQVTAIEISSKALEVAKRNANENRASVLWMEDDFLDRSRDYDIYDLIVSNPPYIPEEELNAMDANVTQYEPHLALFVPNDNALVFYKELAEFATNHLTPNGYLYAEIHYNKGDELVSLFNTYRFSSVRIEKDLFGRDRTLIIQK